MKTRERPPEKGRGKVEEDDPAIMTTEATAMSPAAKFRRLARGVLNAPKDEVLKAERAFKRQSSRKRRLTD